MNEIVNDMSGAKVGDRVFVSQGPEPREDKTNAIIVSSVRGGFYPLKVRCDDSYQSRAYTPDGKFSITDFFPSLFWSMPEITVPERPRRTVKKKITIIPVKDFGNKQKVGVPVFPFPQCWLQNGPEQEITIKIWEEEE